MFDWFKNKKVVPEVKKSFSNSNGVIYLNAKESKEFSDWCTSWVNVGVSIRAENVAQSTLTMYKKKGKDKVEVLEHPFLNDIVNSANKEEQTWFELVYLISLCLDVWGKAFIYAVAGTSGKPAEFRLLAPFAMKQVWNQNKTVITHYEFSSIAGVVKYLPEEIIFFRLPKVGEPFDGMPTIKSCEKIVEIDNIQNYFQRNWTLNSGNISEIITSAETLSDEAYARLDDAMKKKHDPSNNSPYAIFEDGLTFQAIKTSAKELDFVNSKVQTRDEILRKLRVPDIVLGGNSANYATAKMQLNSFINNTIQPFSKFIVDKLNIFIKKTYGKEFFITFEWNTSDPRDDKDLYDMLLKNNVIDPEEVRPIYGFGKRPNKIL